jgi:hypothetical protein
MLEGNVWVKPPAWIDPKRRLIRNTTTDATQRMRKLGQQLRLALLSSPSMEERERCSERARVSLPSVTSGR